LLPAISATCASECVRALRGDGMIRSIGQCSSRISSGSDLPNPFIAFPMLLTYLLPSQEKKFSDFCENARAIANKHSR